MTWSWRHDMTLGEATWRLSDEHQPIACACVGPPSSAPFDSPCYCRLVYIQAERLQRAAHIVVKLLDEVAARADE